jgi:hypothetical protein
LENSANHTTPALVRPADSWEIARVDIAREPLGMQVVRSILKSKAAALMIVLIAALSLCALAADTGCAQTSMGGSEATPPEPPVQPPIARPRLPQADYIPPSQLPSQPSQPAPDSSGNLWWGAIGFTADGSYSTTWKVASQAEAEAKVAKKCSEYGRGACKVVSFSGAECVGLATFIGSYKRRRWLLSFTAGGNTYPEATNAAMNSCNSDERSQGRCTYRVAACADGR